MVVSCDEGLFPSKFHIFGVSAAVTFIDRSSCNGTNTLPACPEGWSGTSDILDMDGVACHRPLLALQVVYYGIVIVSAILLYLMVKTMQHHYGVFKGRQGTSFTMKGKKKKKKWYRHRPLQIQTTGIVTLTFLTCLCLPRCIPGMNHHQVGVSTFRTYAYILTFISFFAGSSVFAFTSTETAIQSLCACGAVSRKSGALVLVSFRKSLQLGFLVYCLGKIAPLLLLYYGQIHAPLVYGVIVSQHFATLVQCAIMYLACRRMKAEVRQLICLVPESGKGASQQGDFEAEKNTKLAQALQRLHDSANDATKTAASGAIFFFLLLWPVLWPYQELCVIFGSFVAQINILKLFFLYRSQNPRKDRVGIADASTSKDAHDDLFDDTSSEQG